MISRLPPLKSLQAFRFAGEEQSFKIAAQRLNVTPTAISQQIKMLEENLGVLLFKRLTREVELTSEGRMLLPYISRSFNSMEEGVSKLMQDPEPNRLTLTSLPSFAGRWLVPRLGNFQRQEPDINIHLSPGLDLVNFEGKDLDLAIRFGRGNYPGLVSKLLLKDYLLPVCHPSLIQKGQSIPQQLSKLPILMDDAPDMKGVLSTFEDVLGAKLRQESTPLHVSDSTMLVEAVLCGQGFAMLRYSLAYELLESGHLICAVPIYLKSEFDFYLVAPELNFKRSKVRRFENWIRKEIKVIETSWENFHRAQLNNSPPALAKDKG